jgi:hypothetical protein
VYLRFLKIIKFLFNELIKLINDFDEEKINNVHDAYEGLSYLIHLEKFKKMNDVQYSKLEKIGDLHIYEDGRPMEFNKNI